MELQLGEVHQVEDGKRPIQSGAGPERIQAQTCPHQKQSTALARQSSDAGATTTIVWNTAAVAAAAAVCLVCY